jgi:hypothetical protein
MLFNKDKKVALLTPPRTGSHTARVFLRSSDWFALKPPKQHDNLTELVVNYPNLNNYTVYCFLRDPLKRFESTLLFWKQYKTASEIFQIKLQKIGITTPIAEISYDEIVDNFHNLFELKWNLMRPLASWLDDPRVIALDFDNYDNELRRIAGKPDAVIQKHFVSSDFGKSVVTDKVRAFVREFYAADYALAKDRLGKEYNP